MGEKNTRRQMSISPMHTESHTKIGNQSQQKHSRCSKQPQTKKRLQSNKHFIIEDIMPVHFYVCSSSSGPLTEAWGLLYNEFFINYCLPIVHAHMYKPV